MGRLNTVGKNKIGHERTPEKKKKSKNGRFGQYFNTVNSMDKVKRLFHTILELKYCRIGLLSLQELEVYIIDVISVLNLNMKHACAIEFD